MCFLDHKFRKYATDLTVLCAGEQAKGTVFRASLEGLVLHRTGNVGEHGDVVR